jgi:hypothetical protein
MDPHIILAVVHLVVIVPFLLYIYFTHNELPDIMFKVVFGLGAFVLIYQMYKTYIKLAAAQSPWVNLIHIFLLAPLLLIIGYYGKETSRKYFEMLLMMTFAAAGYHGWSLIQTVT